MTDIGLTHIALEVSDLDASITFYATFAKDLEKAEVEIIPGAILKVGKRRFARLRLE